jgi:hypothetical protein
MEKVGDLTISMFVFCHLLRLDGTGNEHFDISVFYEVM